MSSFLKRNKVDYVFIDWFGVLSTNYYWCVQSKKHQNLKAWCDQVFHNSEMLNDWMRGKHTLESLSKLGRLTAEQIIDLFLKDIEFYRPDNELLEALDRLFPKAKKVLVTDNMVLFDHILQKYELLNSYFDRMYFSHEIGLLKNDQPDSLFDHILRDLELPNFENCLLVDDSQSNCELFKSFGGRSILVN